MAAQAPQELRVASDVRRLLTFVEITARAQLRFPNKVAGAETGMTGVVVWKM